MCRLLFVILCLYIHVSFKTLLLFLSVKISFVVDITAS